MKKILSYRRFWTCFWLAAAIICMVVIFVMSHQPAGKSAEMSGTIARWLMEHGMGKRFAENIQTVVRKTAHCLEYFGLGLCLGMCLYAKKGYLRIKDIMILTGICVGYAVSDEVHQLFIEGRAGQIKDVLIDTAGSFASLFLLYIFEVIKKRIIRGRQSVEKL